MKTVFKIKHCTPLIYNSLLMAFCAPLQQVYYSTQQRWINIQVLNA